MNRVAIWNGGIVPVELRGKDGADTRGNTEFNPIFDLGLLSEEVVEFYTSLAKNDIVEMIDAYCDARFVWEGIQFKFGMIKYDYSNKDNIKLLNENMDNYSAIRHYYYASEVQMHNCLSEYFRAEHKETFLEAILDTHYIFVCEANGIGSKSGSGANAAILWQQGKEQEVIDYCINDIKLTRELFDLIQDKGEIIDPRINNFYFKKYNPEFEFKPIKVKKLEELIKTNKN